MDELGASGVEGALRRFETERPGFPGVEYVPRYAELASFHRSTLVDRVDGVVIITIRRPAQRNAMTMSLNEEVLDIVRENEGDDSVLGFVITGWGTTAFSAGADVGAVATVLGDDKAAAQYARDFSRLLHHLDTMTKPVVAALNGYALGGGAELAFRCHDRVARPDVYLQLPEIKLGLLPGAGGMSVPFRRWPEHVHLFTAMCCGAERLSAATALEIGVVSALEADYDALVRCAVSHVKDLAAHGLPVVVGRADEADVVFDPTAGDLGGELSAEVVAIMLRAIREGIRAASLDDALEIGYRAFGEAACTGAAREGVGRFLGDHR